MARGENYAFCLNLDLTVPIAIGIGIALMFKHKLSLRRAVLTARGGDEAIARRLESSLVIYGKLNGKTGLRHALRLPRRPFRTKPMLAPRIDIVV